MVSDGSGEVGAARITGEVLDIMVKVPTMVNKMTGVDVTNVRILSTKKALGFSKMSTSSPQTPTRL